MKNSSSPFTFIDLFAGIGGIRLGLEKNGFKCVFTSEIDKFAIRTYKANFNSEVSGDITKVDLGEIPDFDILAAGFPCQPFSHAGKKEGFLDTRGTLFFEIMRIVKAKRPKALLLENVKGLKSHDKGNTLKIIIKSLEDEGYLVYYEVLNAKDFSLPQNRERIFIIAFREDLPNKSNFSFPKKRERKVLLGSILEDRVKGYNISDRLWAGHKRRLLNHRTKGNGFGYKLFDKDSEYTSTLSARYYKDGSEILIKDGRKNPRKLTPRECARLQGFPDKFKIVVSDNQAYKQFGNSVSVPVIIEIGRQIKKVLIS